MGDADTGIAMTSCQRPGPVFLDGGGAETGFLEDVFGSRILISLRQFWSESVDPSSPPYMTMPGCWGGTYFEASISSFASLGVVILALAAGVTAPFRKRAALGMLAVGVSVSLIDFGVRFANRLNRSHEIIRELMWDGLLNQLISNVVFQFGVPFTFGLALAQLLRGSRWSVNNVFGLPPSTR
jgi:hypothetical protein